MNRSLAYRAGSIAVVVWVSCHAAAAVVDPATAAASVAGAGQGLHPMEWALETATGPAGSQPSMGTGLGHAVVPLSEWVPPVVPPRTSDVSLVARILPPTVFVAGTHDRSGEGPTFDNERREATYRAIAESPGRYVGDLATVTDIPESTLRYHLRVLEDDGLVRSMLHRGKRRYYPVETDRQMVVLEAALDDDSTAPILEAVARLEPADVTAIAADVDVGPSTVSYHLQRLAEEELVDRERTGQTVVTRLDPAVRTYLARETDPDRTAP